jgi:Zn-dependent protease with chaperone function
MAVRVRASRGPNTSRAFALLVTGGLLAEGAAAWLAYSWGSQVLPCRWALSWRVFGPPSPTCPMPIALVGHHTLVPAVLLGLLVTASVTLFARSFVAIAVATGQAKRDCARRAVNTIPLLASSIGPNVSPKWLVVIAQDEPTAFCVGLLRPSVVVSSGLVSRLAEPGLRAVVDHELAHRRRRDPLRYALAKSAACGLFFLPSLRDLADATRVENEVSADASAARYSGKAALATALLEVLGHPVPAGSAAMATKDLISQRLDALESGERPRVELRLARTVVSVAAVAGLLVAAAWLRYPSSPTVELPSHPVPPSHKVLLPHPGP